MAGATYEGKCSSVVVVADSINPAQQRITTLQLRYPRFIHAEFMTHRMFSRNASSSRAIPVLKMIEQVQRDPAMPIHWGQNQPGMQAGGEIPTHHHTDAKAHWRSAATEAARFATMLYALGVHKQVANRLLEPFQWMHVVVTATEWDNFFKLRIHPAAQPEIQDLAASMRLAMDESTPRPLRWGEWHIPYIDEADAVLPIEETIKVSTARCARVSYVNHESKRPGVEEDLTLHDRLILSRPPHASPAEHQATARSGVFANFNGWASYRWTIEHEYMNIQEQPKLL